MDSASDATATGKSVLAELRKNLILQNNDQDYYPSKRGVSSEVGYSTVHDFALWSGEELRRTRLAEELIRAIERYLLADECVDMVVDALTS